MTFTNQTISSYSFSFHSFLWSLLAERSSSYNGCGKTQNLNEFEYTFFQNRTFRFSVQCRISWLPSHLQVPNANYVLLFLLISDNRPLKIISTQSSDGRLCRTPNDIILSAYVLCAHKINRNMVVVVVMIWWHNRRFNNSFYRRLMDFPFKCIETQTRAHYPTDPNILRISHSILKAQWKLS